MKNKITLANSSSYYSNGRIYDTALFLKHIKHYEEQIAWKKKCELREKKLKRILGLDA